MFVASRFTTNQQFEFVRVQSDVGTVVDSVVAWQPVRFRYASNIDQQIVECQVRKAVTNRCRNACLQLRAGGKKDPGIDWGGVSELPSVEISGWHTNDLGQYPIAILKSISYRNRSTPRLINSLLDAERRWIE